MRRLATWIISSETGHSDIFTLPQTPKNIADEFAHDLTYPTFLDGQDYFALGVWALPEGCDFPDDVPEAEQSNFYMQAGGSNRGMAIEVRVPDPVSGYAHYVVAREPVKDPDAWVPLSWNNGGDKPFTTHVHPEEVFTGQQAVPPFRAYILTGQIPPPTLLRRITIQNQVSQAPVRPRPARRGATARWRRLPECGHVTQGAIRAHALRGGLTRIHPNGSAPASWNATIPGRTHCAGRP